MVSTSKSINVRCVTMRISRPTDQPMCVCIYYPIHETVKRALPHHPHYPWHWQQTQTYIDTRTHTPFHILNLLYKVHVRIKLYTHVIENASFHFNTIKAKYNIPGIMVCSTVNGDLHNTSLQ